MSEASVAISPIGVARRKKSIARRIDEPDTRPGRGREFVEERTAGALGGLERLPVRATTRPGRRRQSRDGEARSPGR
jgi:hypothetical protein